MIFGTDFKQKNGSVPPRTPCDVLRVAPTLIRLQFDVVAKSSMPIRYERGISGLLGPAAREAGPPPARTGTMTSTSQLTRPSSTTAANAVTIEPWIVAYATLHHAARQLMLNLFPIGGAFWGMFLLVYNRQELKSRKGTYLFVYYFHYLFILCDL